MFSVLFVVFSAYLFRRFNLLRAEDSRILISYVVNFALPIFAFKSLYTLGIGSHLIKISVSAWITIISSALLALALGLLIRLDKKDLKTFLLVSSFGNTAFLGYPITYAFFGREGLLYAVLYDNLGSFLLVSSLGVLIATSGFNLKVILSFPPFIGLILGILASPYQLPKALLDTLDFVSASVLPVILFSVGLNLSFGEIKNNLKLSLLALFIKMLLSPAVALFVGHSLGLSKLELSVVVLESSMPTMIMASVLALKYKLNYQLAFACAGLGMLISFLLSPLIVKLLALL